MKSIIALALLLYGGGLLYLYFFQDRLIFRTDLAPKEVSLPQGAKRLFIEGLEVGFIDKKSDTTLFYFGGNADNALEALHLFQKLPYNVVALNYPGYGNSQGTPSQESLLEAAKKIFLTFQTKHNIVVGRSLGSGVAGFIASQFPVEKIVLITPYHSITHLAQLRYPIYPVKLLLHHPFELWRWIKKSDAPVLILAAQNDSTTPPATLQKLLPYIPNLQGVITIAHTTHADILQAQKTKEVLEEFLAPKGTKD